MPYITDEFVVVDVDMIIVVDDELENEILQIDVLEKIELLKLGIKQIEAIE